MGKRKQPEAAEPPDEPAAAGAAADKPAAKRRRSPRSAARPAAKLGTPAALQAELRSAGGSAAAAAAAAGRAESDVEDAGEEEQAAAAAAATLAAAVAPSKGAQPAAGEEQPEVGTAGVAEQQAGEDKQRRWVGVKAVTFRWSNDVRWRASVLVFPHQGSRERRQLSMGHHATREAAARIHDRAVIALHGRKGAAVSGLLNFPVEQYPGEQQRYGPDLNAFLRSLCALGEDWLRRKKPRPPRQHNPGRSPEHMRRMREKRAANAAAAPPPASYVHQGMAALRQRDPLYYNKGFNCGACPACRQPWRTDLGTCQLRATANSTGHKEKVVIEMLACDPHLRTAAMKRFEVLRLQQRDRDAERAKAQLETAAGSGGESGQEGGAGEEGGGEAAGEQAGGSRAEGGLAAAVRAAAGLPEEEEEEEEELEWLEQLPNFLWQPQAQAKLRAMRGAAAAPLDQQLAWQAQQLAAALEAEDQRQGAAAGVGEGAAAGAAAAGAAAAVAAGQVQPAERALVDPASGLTRAAVPRSVLPQQQAKELLMLAGLCREGDLEAPLVAEGAGQVLEAAGRQQAQQERLAALMLRRAQRGQSGSRDGSPELDGQLADAAEQAAEAASEGGVSDADAAARLDAPDGAGQGLHCLLCGGKSHGKAGGFKACPVFKMALAVPKPPQECPGCAHLEQPGCKLCLASGRKAEWRQALERPFVRRAPWLDDVLPATRELMQAVQAAATAAVVDFDLPGAAWRCTPKALLAAGLLAEEAAKRELAARFPPQQAQQQQREPPQQREPQQREQHQREQQQREQQQRPVLEG